MKKRDSIIYAIPVAILIIILLLIRSCTESNNIGKVIDSYKGVAVYNNGKEYTICHGQNYSKDGYYFGYKWQCVEFVKRFYYIAKNHKMPDGFGNAKDFFDDSLKQGEFNSKRGLVQYRNGGDMKPKEEDILVFTDTNYGHVAVLTKVTDDYIEVIQQNVYKVPRQKYKLTYKDGKYYIGEKKQPAGWLRKI